MATTSDMHLDDVFYKKADDFFAANAGTGLTYDDVSLATCFSDVLPRMTRLDTTISDRIALSLPIMSADMDTVTESTMAIAMALHGGIGMIHYNMTNADQVAKVRRVKTYIHGMIDRPATVPADLTVGDVLEMIERNDYNFSTFPVTDAKGKLLGLLRGGVVKSRHAAHKVSDVMIPREQVLTIQEKDLGGDPIATADRIFLEHIGTNKILVVDAKDHLRGLFTLSDIERIRDESGTDAIRPSRDENFRLRCGASVAVPRYPDGRVNYDALDAHVADLVGAGADAVIISTAHGHSAGVGECVRFVRDHFKDLTIIAGNVTSGEGVEFLAEAGADSVKIGQGPGSICSTRIVAGVGIPQLTALYVSAQAAKKKGVRIIADGGITKSGDIVKALTLSDCVMLGGMLAYTSIAMDERDGWNRFALTTGYSRKEYVLSKYLLGVVGTLFCSLTMGVFSLIGMSMGKINAENNIIFLLPVLIGGTLIMLSVALPLSFWFGMEKARLLSILIIALACGFTGAFAGFTEGNDGLPFQGWSFTGLMMIVVSVIILALSVMISLKVFDRREF